MGWGSGNGKAEVLNHAAGDVVVCGDNGAHPFAGKHVLIDVSGLAHKAAKKDAATVVRDGVSPRQLQYVRARVESVAAEGGTPVLVLDGRAYPPKLATRKSRSDERAAALLAAQAAERAGKKGADVAKLWKAAAGPQEPFWLALLEECVLNQILFIVSPYEADAQLVSLANELGDGAIIWAAANDSDLVVFGGLDVIYDWDHTARSYRRVRLLDGLLGATVNKRSFVGKGHSNTRNPGLLM